MTFYRGSAAGPTVLCAGGMMTTLTHTMVLPIQADLALYLKTSASSASWVVTIYVVAAAVTMPVAGRLGDILGTRRMLATFGAIVLGGSIVCALSNSLLPMLLGRSLQGMGMGFFPVGMSLMSTIAPPRHRVSWIAALSSTSGVGAAIGLPFGGWLASAHGWHALFWVIAAVAAAILAAVVMLIPPSDDAHRDSVDLPGVLGLAVGLIAVLIGISKGSTWGWGDPLTVSCLVGGMLVLLVWGRYERVHPAPLIDLRTSVRPVVLLTNLTAAIVGFGMLAQIIVVPQLLRLPAATGYGLEQSPFAAGLWMAPTGLAMLIASFFAKALVRKIGVIYTMMVGSCIIAAGYGCALVMMGSAWTLMIAACVTSVGVALAYAVMPLLLLDAVRPSEAGATIGVNLLLRSIGTAVASAVMTMVLAGSTTMAAGVEVPRLIAFETCFVVGAVASLAAAAMALFIGRADHSKAVALQT